MTSVALLVDSNCLKCGFCCSAYQMSDYLLTAVCHSCSEISGVRKQISSSQDLASRISHLASTSAKPQWVFSGSQATVASLAMRWQTQLPIKPEPSEDPAESVNGEGEADYIKMGFCLPGKIAFWPPLEPSRLPA